MTYTIFVSPLYKLGPRDGDPFPYVKERFLKERCPVPSRVRSLKDLAPEEAAALRRLYA